MVCAYRIGEDTSLFYDETSQNNWIIVGLEIKAAGAAVPGPPPPLRHSAMKAIQRRRM
jgi:hypothetical protein